MLITLFTGVLAYLAYLQWRAMDKQAQHMRDALTETKRASEAALKSAQAAETSANATSAQFELAERPWLSMNISPLGDITFDASGMNLRIGCCVTNIGKSPATGVRIKSIMHFSGENKTHVIDERVRLVEEVAGLAPLPSVVLPQQENCTVIELNRSQNYINDNLSPGSEYISVAVITCVCYRPTFNGDTVYYTSTIHHVGHRENDRSWTVLKVGQGVPMGDVITTINPSFGLIAG
jgi:hypothetical protein